MFFVYLFLFCEFAELCSDMRQSAQAEFCSVAILLRQNFVRHPVTLLGQSVRTRVQPFGTLLGQSVRERFCSSRTVFDCLALCSSTVFGNDSARAESCSAVWHSARGRVFGNDSARVDSCSAVWHSARAECSGTILLRQNRVRPFGTLLGQSVWERFCSGRAVFGHLALCSGRKFGNDSARRNRVRPFGTLLGQSVRERFCSGRIPSTSQPSPSLPAKNALGDVKDQAENEANPKPWYKADEKSSKMSTEDLVELLLEYPLPYARLPGLQEPANYGTKYETGIYEEQVKSGYMLPLHPFVLRFFEHYHMARGQLVPNGWRKLVGLIYLVQTSGYKPDATDFMRVFFEIYFVKGVSNCPRWYYIHSRYFFVGRSDKGKLPFDKEWNPYCKDFKNPGKPAPNNLTKHILSHIKLQGGLSIDEPLLEQQLDWARIFLPMPVPAGTVTPPHAPTISSTFLAESAPLEMASGSGKTPQGGFLGVLQKAKGKRKEKQAMQNPCSKEDKEQHLVHGVLPWDKEIFQNQTHETFACSFAQAVYTMYPSGSEMLSRFEMARQVAAEEAQQKREAIKEAEEATRRAEELSKQETDYLAQIETLEMRLERAKRRVTEEVKKARIRDFLDGNAGDEWLKKRTDDGLEIYELGFMKAKEMFAERFLDISLDDFVLPAVISPFEEIVLLSEASDAAASPPPGEGPSGNAPEP
ncbi:LOW QUALITY PROTEIN: hypothetical protein RJ639_045235 [Escallonia herrerae]|uniref:Transposase (putative) gypsy type domain-containing protein n=1 Tax=Escallonia herrerae TaxID=1293975 RepID=A0AA89B1J3_9ASTE|nr:LOW QUALITY PROTEIN: hypothetical protein RJ639_045235 [Escallonia herrerae]